MIYMTTEVGGGQWGFVHMKTFNSLWSVHKVETSDRFKGHTTQLKINVQF